MFVVDYVVSNKVVCFLDEANREREFYLKRGVPNPKDAPPNSGDTDTVADVHAESDYHRTDEQVNVCLECVSSNLKTLKRRFIRCSSQATILHLKKFVAKKVLNGMDKYRDVSYLVYIVVSILLRSVGSYFLVCLKCSFFGCCKI